jgi:hypothetical protein
VRSASSPRFRRLAGDAAGDRANGAPGCSSPLLDADAPAAADTAPARPTPQPLPPPISLPLLL